MVPVFAGGLDFSSPVKKFFYDPLGSGKAFVDTVVSLTGALLFLLLSCCYNSAAVGVASCCHARTRLLGSHLSSLFSKPTAQPAGLHLILPLSAPDTLRPVFPICCCKPSIPLKPTQHKTGFALVGGPARQDAPKAVEALTNLNVPYLVSLPLVFQTTEEWLDSELGVHPVQVALQVRKRAGNKQQVCGWFVLLLGTASWVCARRRLL